MDKSYLNHIREVIETINNWPQMVHMHLEGSKMFENYITNFKDTRFSDWYYGEGQIFSDFRSFVRLEKYYLEAFQAYLDFMNFRKKNRKKSFLFFRKEKTSTELQELYDDFLQKTNTLKLVLMDFYKEVYSSPLFLGLTDGPVKSGNVPPAGEMPTTPPATTTEKTVDNGPADRKKGTSGNTGGGNDDDFDIDEEIKKILS